MASITQAQDQLAQMKAAQDRLQEETEENISHMRARVQKLEKQNHDLEMKLEDEKRYDAEEQIKCVFDDI